MYRYLLVLFSAIIIAGAIVFTAYVKPEGTLATASSPLSENQKNEISALVEQYILNNPQTIIAAMQNMQRQEEERRQQAMTESVKLVLPSIYADKMNPVLGNPDAAFTIVKLYDYGCGYCKRMSKMLMDPILKNGNIRWIFVETPIFGPESDFAARISMAAYQLGRFKEMHEALIETSDLSQENIQKIAEERGFDWAALKAIADSQEMKDKMVANASLAQQVGLNGVPMFIIDGKVIPGAFGQEVLDDMLQKANERAGQK